MKLIKVTGKAQLASTLFSADLHENKFRDVPKKLSVFIIQLNCWKITFT
uniref:Uncharacterized protein n=1 Tax=Brassica campestris TaxID=3711 RepID=A0A3P5ZZW4_BRACM|nr:unnamed protein product [Brassica rapa]